MVLEVFEGFSEGSGPETEESTLVDSANIYYIYTYLSSLCVRACLRTAQLILKSSRPPSKRKGKYGRVVLSLH